MIKVLYVRTKYEHWGGGSGYNRLLDYVGNEIQVREIVVPLAENKNSLLDRVGRFIKCSVAKQASSVYAFNDLAAELKALFIIIIFRIDVIHFMDGEHGIHLFPVVIKKIPLIKKPKIVVTYHQPGSDLRQFVNVNTLKEIDMLVVLCREQLDFFAKYKHIGKCKVIYHGVDTQYFSPSKKDPNKTEVINCLTVGSWLRDYRTVIETALEMSDEKIKFHLVYRGDVGSGVPHNVVVHKDISDDELLSLYQTCDLLFMPLLKATANNVVLEAMSCGLPVMSSRIESLYEYTGKNNPLLLNNVAQSYVKALSSIIENPEKLKKLSVNSRCRAEFLSWSNISRNYIAMYKELLT